MMNPSSAPYTNPQFHPSQIPNPNPQFFNSSLPPPPPPPITESRDFSTTLTSLTHLLTLSNQYLTTLSSLLPNPQNASSLVPCPHNSHHLMPPESLFLHILQCPSPLFQNPSSFFNSLHYPKTLHLNNTKDTSFTRSFDDTNNSELCISLDAYFDEFGSNYFYRDCPGVVRFNDIDSSRKMINLPSFLSIECGNYGADCEGKWRFDEIEFNVLPSELWPIQREIEGWVDYPSTCSYNVVCAILRLLLVKWSDLRKWVMVNSPSFGVVIDVFMRDHICVLFVLCLKAIRREAIKLIGCKVKMISSSFDCPALVQVLLWISSQLSVLYGEVNAKYFAIHIFKQCVLAAAKEALLFPLKSNLGHCPRELDKKKSDNKNFTHEGPLEGSNVSELTKEIDGIDSMVIDTSQVAAAIAALLERSLLERKLKELRNSRLPPAYQRMAEHTNVTMRADEERKQRPNYRAIIEHDGLLRKQSDNQETNKSKTKQELLAEERDYKRRRMSYRGKKLKRSTLEVMRDIIDEYMEEIKQAGGIGCFDKTREEGMSSKLFPAPDVTMTINGIEKVSEYSQSNKATPSQYRRHNRSDFDKECMPLKHGSPENYEQQKSTGDRDKHLEYWHRNTSRDRSARDYHSVSPQSYNNDGWPSERSSHRQRQQDGVKFSRARNHDEISHRSNHGDDSYREKYDKKSDGRVGHQRIPHQGHSNRWVQYAFDDRYNPTESHDSDE